mmetsp:Transcript_23010/g.50507  ORF Transcript_23010/g.50507 Transcript_23010/m.50507 type:complete len:815 (+) Transcript_23010:66-2510(+)
MSHLPKLPERRKSKARAHDAESLPPVQNVGSGGATEKAETFATNPAVQKLLANPSLITDVVSKDPGLQALLGSNPAMSKLLAPEKLQQVLQLLKDPQAALSGGAPSLISEEDLPMHRMGLMQLQNYAAQLQRSKMFPNQAAAAAASSSSAEPPSTSSPLDGSSGGPGPPFDPMMMMQARMAQLQHVRMMQQGGAGGPAGYSWPPQHYASGSTGQHVMPPAGDSAAQHAQLPTSSDPYSSGADVHAPLQPVSFYYGSATPDQSYPGYHHAYNSAPQGYHGMPGYGYQAQQQQYSQPPGGSAAHGHYHHNTEGSYSYTHTERDVAFHELPAELQQQVRDAAAAAGMPGAAAGQGPWSAYGGFGAGDPGSYRQGAGQAGAYDPRTYYEHVEPSPWRPQDEEADDCRELYRRAYCTYADAMFPPLWVALAIGGIWTRALPFWALVPLLIVSFFGGVYIFGVILAGIPSSRLPLSRIIPSFILTLELVFPVLYFWRIAPVWSGAYTPSGLCLAVLLLCLAPLHIAAALTDPGYIKRPGDAAAPSDEEKQALLLAQGPNSCWTCAVDRPLRSKHCQVCNRCVRRFDHHCPAVGNCIGEGNQRLFFTYITAMLVAQILYFGMSCSFLQQLQDMEQGQPPVGPSWRGLLYVLPYAASTHRGLLLAAVLQMLICIGVTYLFVRGLFCIASNLTTSELLTRQRYPYLNHETAGYSNRFDRGVLHNCWQFWLEPVQDWWAEFEKGDKEMLSQGKTLMTVVSPGVLLRMFDVYTRRRVDSIKRWEDMRMQQALKNLGVHPSGAASSAAAACQGPGCSARHHEGTMH